MIEQLNPSLTKEANKLLKHPIAENKSELKNIQQLFWQLLKNYPDGSISIVDKDYNFTYTGGEIYKQLETDPAAWIGKKMFLLFPPSLRKEIKAQLSEVFQGNNISDFELHDCCFAGQSYAMDAFPLIEQDRTIKKAGIIIRNISKLKIAEENLKKALGKERELGELKSRFVSMASHEFRTPLSTILSSSYLLTKYTTTEEQPKREKHLDRIISSVNMLTDILNDFLSLGKIEEGKIAVNLTNIVIKEFIEAIINEIKPLLKKNQAIVYKHPGNNEILLDKGLLKHIVLNLLSNAIKFSGEESLIEIATTENNGEFVLSVKDHGIGIAGEDQKHLFERFFRGGNVSHIQGTGLGLHIVSRYAELMNGAVMFKSELGKGTEVIVAFRKLNR
jgi:signal transduction histidine kinase